MHYAHGHTVYVHFCITYDTVTVEPSNKGHFGTNISYVILSFTERLSFSLRFKIDLHVLFVWVLEECPLLRGVLFIVPILECPLSNVSLYMAHRSCIGIV